MILRVVLPALAFATVGWAGVRPHSRMLVDDRDRSDARQSTFDLRRGYAALLVKTVFPEQLRYRVLGGRKAAETPDIDLYVIGKNYWHMHRHLKDFFVMDFSQGALPAHTVGPATDAGGWRWNRRTPPGWTTS